MLISFLKMMKWIELGQLTQSFELFKEKVKHMKAYLPSLNTIFNL